MASLAENSVVLSIRDWQWETRRFQTRPPQTYVSLTGTGEKLLGDGAVAIGDRYFLLEVKATVENITSEWDVAKDRNPKNAFRKIRSELATSAKGQDGLETDLMKIAFKSLAGHYFVYWEPIPGTKPATGKLVAMPYLLAMRAFGGLDHGLRPDLTDNEERRLAQCNDFVKRFRIGVSLSPSQQDEKLPIEYIEVHAFTLDMLLSSSARIIFSDQEGGGEPYSLWHHVGVDASTLKSYVDFMRSSDDPEINCLILSTSGFLAHSRNLSELYSLLTELEQQDSTAKATAKVEHADSVYESLSGYTPPKAAYRPR
jgi:hypothetical protein